MKFKVDVAYRKGLSTKSFVDLGFEIDNDGDVPYINSIGELNHGKVEIDTLEDLLFFIEQYGQIVLNKNSIEIYNEYRE